MKKLLKTGKKTLSVIMAVMMVLTAWVWVAPTEAEAVNAGKYYVRVSYDCADKYDNGSEYTGPNFTETGAGYTIYYASDNGTGTSTWSASTVVNLTDECKSNFTTKTKVTECPGFPTAVHYYNKGGTIWSRTYGITKVEVASASSGATWTTLWEGDVEADAASTQWKAKIDKDGATKINTGTGDWVTFSTTTKNWEYPKAKSIVWNSVNTTNITLSSNGSSNYTRDFKYVVKDKYGVILSDTALESLSTPVSYTLNSTNFPTLNNTGTIGTSSSTSPNLYHTYTNGTSEYQVSVKVNDKLRSLVDGINERKVTLKVTCGTLSSTKTFNINDSKHKITFDKNATDASDMIPASYDVYYGESLATQATIDGRSTYPTSGNKTGYTFMGMYDASTGGNLMNINAEVTSDKTYYAHWEINKYAAVFMDRSGNNVVLVQSNIPYGSAATSAAEAALKLNKIEYDDVNHYTLNEDEVWDPSTDSVTENIFFYPNYTEGAHTLDGGTAISATCQHGAGIEYNCTVCDYSYIEETSTTLGDHTKSASYIVDVEPTCIATGEGHYYCTVCGTTVETITIPAKGHSYQTETTKNATCIEEGSKTYSCTNCDYSYEESIPLVQHNYKAGEKVAATCQHSAYTPYTCEVCGDAYNKYEGNATTAHNWNITVSDVTASNTKVVTGNCLVCSASFTKEVELPATHNFTKVEITTQPTCQTAGEIKISCADADCTESYTATLPVVATAHAEYETTYISATCGVNGSVVTKCKACGETVAEKTISALNHSYDYVRVEPTCTTDGSITKTCANCGDVKTETIATAGHKTVTVEANCKHDGYVKCAVCDEIISTTKKTFHDYSGEVKEVAATCTTDGMRITKCKDCDAYTVDTLTKPGHNTSSEWTIVVPDTCEGEGYRIQICSRCNIIIDTSVVDNIKGHNYSAVTSKEATCTENGEKVYTCTNDANHTYTELMPATGHNWDDGVTTAATCISGGYITYTCQTENCGQTRVEVINGSTALLHDFTGTETIVSAATCETDGEKTVKCSRCDVTTTVIIPKLGHTYGAWEVVKEATNSEDGQWKRVCGNNAEHIEYLTIPKGDHTWDKGTVTKSATCTTEGTMVYKCTAHTNCGITLEATIPVAQHTVNQRENAATCTKTGTVEAYCSVCNVVLSTEEIPVKAHTFVAQAAVAPTCTTAGYTPYKCSDCDFTYNVFDGAQATGHVSWTETGRTNATCTTDGSVSYKCNKCDATKTEVLPKTGHNYVKGTVVNADCTTAGTEVYTCSCNDTYTKFIEPAKGHSFTNWEVVTAATTDKYGVQKGTCSCGEVEYALLAPIGNHSFTATVTKSATCTEKGEKTFTCSAHTNCTANYTEEIPATGHTQKLEYIAPTCIAVGYSKIVCSVESCKAEIMSKEIPAIGYHNFSGEGVKVDAGCNTEGSITYTCLTDGCNATKVETIPAKGHTFSTTVTDAKCGVAGSVVTECKVCNDPTAKTIYELAAKGHIWGATPTETVDAKCETNGSETYKCQNCDAENVIVIPATGHTWGAWTVTPSTNTVKGSVSRECSVCKKNETVEIPAGGHNLVVDNEKSTDATCTTEGTTIYGCENHDNCGITVTVTVPVKQHTIVKENKEASCTQAGYSKTYCSVCNEEFNSVVIQVKAHEYVAQDAVAPTCTTSGYTPYKCSCDDTYNVYDATKPATGHTFVKGASTATCIADGEMTLTCACGYSTTVNVPALGHSYGDGTVVQQQSCVDVEKTEYKCDSCSVTYIEITKEAKGHSFGNWTKVQDATDDKFGIEKRICSVEGCNAEEFRTTEPIGMHTFKEEITKSATCTEKGQKTFTCTAHSDCTANYTEEIPATGHTQKLEYTAPSCNAVGYSKVLCEKCPEVILSQEIPALGHIWVQGAVTPATCNTKGSIAYSCKNCTATDTAELSTNANAHQYATVVIAPTCTNPGSVVTKCALCKDVTTNDTLAAKGHTFTGEEKTVKEATCTTDGEKTVKCADCDVVEKVVIAKLGHDWNDWVKVDATNDADGSWTRTCKNDAKHVETVVIPKGDHKWDDGTVTKEASCTETGTKVYKCKTHTGDAACGVTFTVTLDKLQHEIKVTSKDATCDANGEVVTKCENCETQTIITTIPATGHNYSSTITKEASCTEEGVRTYTCAHDANHTYTEAVAKLQHTYVAGTPVAATCTSSGYTPYACTCGSEYVLITAPAKTHSYTEKVSSTADCLNGGKLTLKCACGVTMETDVPALGHNYTMTSSTTASCAAAATETYKCSVCNDVYTKVIGAKTDAHKYIDNWVIEKPATENSIGYKTRACTVCGQIEVAEIEATGEHQFTAGDIVESKAATCTENGYEIRKCSVHTGAASCGMQDTIIIYAEGHKEKLSYTPATCETAGETKIVCETCTAAISAVTTIPALGHAWKQGDIVNATCNAKGSIAYSCERCAATNTVEFENRDAHNFKTTTVLSTCDAEGSVTVTCENGCGYNETTTIPKLQHNWGEWKKTDATNEADGEWKRICNNDADHVETVVIPKGDHKWDDGTVTKEASCTETGTKVYRCKTHTGDAACGVTITVNTGYAEHTYVTEIVKSCSTGGSVRTYCKICDKTVGSIDIGKAQHEYAVESTTDPTCTSSGYTTYKCKNCDSRYSEIGAAPVGHTIIKSESKATCTTGDTIVISCENCGFKQEVEVPALGHDYTKIGSTDATCAAAATETYECSRDDCNASYTISVGEKTKAHSWNDWEVVEEASYTSLGYKIRTCKICSKLEVETIPATGDHVFDVLEKTTAPGCETEGEEIYSCSKHPGENGCKLTSIVTLPAAGHDEIVNTSDATCEDEGTVTTTCSKCDYEKVEIIPALGHTYGEGVVTPSTCNAEGKIEYTCTRCFDVKTVTIDKNENAHQYATVVIAPTCTNPGSVVTKCALCKDVTTNDTLAAKGHTFTGEEKTVKEATCTTDGEKTVKCADCDVVEKVVIAKLGHNMKAGAAVAPTCTTSGYTPYECENKCGHSYNVYDESQPAKGHTWGEWSIVENATQEENGLKRRSCTVCNDAVDEQVIPAMKHEMTETENIASTCISAGHITYKCGVKHDGVVCDYTLVIELPTVAHTLTTTVTEATCTATGSVVTKCTVSGCTHSETITLDTKPHKEILSIEASDCENKGYAVTNCEVCNGEIQRKEIPALGHDYDDSIADNVKVTKEASCKEAGSKTVKCSRCDKTRIVEIAKLSHEFEATETHNATCTESGYVVKDCKNCDEKYNEFISGPIGHKWNSGVVTNPATCTANGVKTYTCSNDASHTYTETLVKLGHDWGDWEVKLNPSATVDGIQARECKICNATETATIPALGGTTTYTVTFVVDGKTVATQTVNHNGKATAPVISNKAPDASSHYSYIWDVDFSRVTSDLTVTAIFTPAAHTYGAWITDIAPTCEAEGRKYRICTADGCGFAQYEAVETVDHTFSVVDSKDPTCTENGYKSVKCDKCGYSEDQTLKRLGHVFTYHESIKPTCDTDGLEGHYSCSRCGKNYKDKAGKTEITDVVISRLYHTYLVVEGSEATCTKEGKTDYMYCTVCGYTRHPEVIPATGHADSNNDNTCDKCGSTYMENGAIVCSCSCHKNGFFNELIYKILSFFWRLFGSNKSCECGKVHY